MLVREMIEAIVHKTLKVKDLAEKYGTSDRTIQTKIKRLGFIWNAKEAKYEFIGEDRGVFELNIDDVFKSKSKKTRIKASSNNDNKTARNEIKKANKEVAATVQDASKPTPENKSVKEIKKASNKYSSLDSIRDIENDSDKIDMLLAGKKTKRNYRGFYFDSDVLDIIDSVDSGVKSDLVNECLRKVFKDKGLL